MQKIPTLSKEERKAKERHIARKNLTVFPRKKVDASLRKSALDSFDSRNNKVDEYGLMD